MGAHYSSIQVRTEDRAAVKVATETVAAGFKKKFLLGPVLDGWIAVYPDDSGRDEQCAAALAKQLNLIVLHLAVFDSDIFSYNFFRDGKLLNEYCSEPDYFEEVSAEEHERLKSWPEVFRELVSSPEKLGELSRLVAGGDKAIKVDFEEHRLEQFAKLLGIRNALTSYEYLARGEHDGLKDWKEFIHIPDQSAEKAAKKAAEAALRAEKQRLQNEGLLCVEILPPGNKKQRANCRGEFCHDPVYGGFLVLWRTHGGKRQPPQFSRYQKPWNSGPQPVELTFSSLSFGSLVMSRTGKWFAFGDNGLKLWDWAQHKLANGTLTNCSPELFSQDEALLLCQWQQQFTLISTKTFQPVKTFLTQSGRHALHPGNKYLVTRPAQTKLGVFNLETGKLEKALFCGVKRDWSQLASAFEGGFKQAGVDSPELAEWKASFIGGTEEILHMKFSADGCLLFCGTTTGLQVFEWDKILSAATQTPDPIAKVVPAPEKAAIEHQQSGNYVYDIVHDEPQNRLLFCGLEGTLRYLNLGDGKTGILFDPPGRSPAVKLQLSSCREHLCCMCTPPFGHSHEESWRIQIWNYPALCKHVGLNF